MADNGRNLRSIISKEHAVARYSGCIKLRERLSVLQACIDNRIVPQADMPSHLREMQEIEILIEDEKDRVKEYNEIYAEGGEKPSTHALKRKELIRHRKNPGRYSIFKEEKEEVIEEEDRDDWDEEDDDEELHILDTCDADEEFLQEGKESSSWQRLSEMDRLGHLDN
jgi:hypothetical protein